MPRRPTARLSVNPLEDRWTPAAGDLDPTFGSGGSYRFPDAVAEATFFNSIAATPDGRLVTVGSGSATNRSVTRVARLTPDGRPDPTFDGDGVVDLPASVGAIAGGPVLVLPDGKILLVGAGLGLVRLTADGQLDPTFGTGGVAQSPAGDRPGRGLAVAPDGRVLVAGQVGAGQTLDGNGQLTGSRAFAVARYTADGQPDPSFDGDGVAVVPVPVGAVNDAGAAAVAVQPDGAVVLAGDAGVAARVERGRFNSFTSFDRQFAVVRLTAAGQLDQGFGDGGRTLVAFGPADRRVYQADAVRVRPDGGIVVAGRATGAAGDAYSSGVVATLTPVGRPDPSFDGDGLAGTADGVSPPAFVASRFATFLPDGGVQFLTGWSLARLTAAGQPDTAFAPNGSADLPFLAASPAGGQERQVAVVNAAPLPDGTVAVLTQLTDDDPRTPAANVVYLARGTNTRPRFASADAGTFQAGGTPDGSVAVLRPQNGTYTTAGGVTPYPDFKGTARTATADINGDGVPDYVAGPGPGGGPNVVVISGATGQTIADLNAFEATFTGGVFVAAADLTGDGKADVVVTPDRGGGPVVAIYDGAKLAAGLTGEAAQLARFYGIVDEAFRGGARAALGDVSGDGKADLVVAAGFGGGPRVAVFDGAAVANPAAYVTEQVSVPVPTRQAYRLVPYVVPPKLVADFFVFEDTLRNGVYVASGDLDADGKAEVIVGGGPGGGPRVQALSGADLLAGGPPSQALSGFDLIASRRRAVADFFAGDPNARGGVRVAVRPDPAGRPQLVTGSGEGEPAAVRVYSPAAARRGGPADQTLAPFGGATLADGVYVG